jgi:hypothetical protein
LFKGIQLQASIALKQNKSTTRKFNDILTTCMRKVFCDGWYTLRWLNFRDRKYYQPVGAQCWFSYWFDLRCQKCQNPSAKLQPK